MTALKDWAREQLPPPLEVWPSRAPARLWLAVAIVHPRPFLELAQHAWWAWTLLPGDHVHDLRRAVNGVVVHVHRPGRVEVVWAPWRDLRRHPALLEDASMAVAARAPMWPDVLWRSTCDATTLDPGWRYLRA